METKIIRAIDVATDSALLQQVANGEVDLYYGNYERVQHVRMEGDRAMLTREGYAWELPVPPGFELEHGPTELARVNATLARVEAVVNEAARLDLAGEYGLVKALQAALRGEGE